MVNYYDYVKSNRKFILMVNLSSSDFDKSALLFPDGICGCVHSIVFVILETCMKFNEFLNELKDKIARGSTIQ